MAFCLPPLQAEKFLAAFRDGTITPDKLKALDSAGRHELFAKMVGEDSAREVNALVESKLLLKNQEAGLIKWAKEVTGISEAARRDLVSQIGRMGELITPANEHEVLQDLIGKRLKLGARRVSMEEVGNISNMSRDVQGLGETAKGTPAYSAERIAWQRAAMKLEDYVDGLKPMGKGVGYWAEQILNLPKSALTSVLHFSAAGVQLWGMITTRPAFEAFTREQFKYFASEENYKNMMASIRSHPDYSIAVAAKLGITKMGDKLSTREEALQSSLLEHVPGLKTIVKASSRAFTGMLDYTRFHRFEDLLNAARARGEDVRVGSQTSRDLANVVNNFTGRGSLGKNDRYANMQAPLNAAFFSPRKIVATMEMFNPVNYLDPRISQTARIAAMRQLLGSVAATAAVLQLAAFAGASVNYNPTSTNFLKIKMGKTTFDPTGGNSVYIRLLARIIEKKSVSSSGRVTLLNTGKFGEITRADEALGFFRDKLSPTAGFIADYLYGKDPIGQPFSVTAEMRDKLIPIVMQDFLKLSQNDSNNTLAWELSIAAVFGVSMQTETPLRK